MTSGLITSWQIDGETTETVTDFIFSSVQFSRSVVFDSWDPMNRSIPGLPVRHHLPEFTQIHVHRVSDAIQPSHPLSSPFPPALSKGSQRVGHDWVTFTFTCFSPKPQVLHARIFAPPPKPFLSAWYSGFSNTWSCPPPYSILLMVTSWPLGQVNTLQQGL